MTAIHVELSEHEARALASVANLMSEVLGPIAEEHSIDGEGRALPMAAMKLEAAMLIAGYTE